MMCALSTTRAALVLTGCAILVLPGCANRSGLDGTSEYGCKAPQGVQCDSVSGNYYNVVQNNLPSQRQGRGRETEIDKTPGSRTPSTPGDTRSAGALRTSQTDPDGSRATAIALPLRSQSRVLRLWFKPWEDADHDLYDQGYVYVQIDSGRWLVDHAQRRIRDAYAPIRAPRSVSQPAQPTAASSKVTNAAVHAPETSTTALRPLIGTPDAASADIP